MVSLGSLVAVQHSGWTQSSTCTARPGCGEKEEGEGGRREEDGEKEEGEGGRREEKKGERKGERERERKEDSSSVCCTVHIGWMEAGPYMTIVLSQLKFNPCSHLEVWKITVHKHTTCLPSLYQ